ncbi:MAG: vitamin K epoxide reductase family protein [Bdellovibrionales bacterium]|nr:vitamin K epoxide reductase family protein [Bdellovibrionales bacterium]
MMTASNRSHSAHQNRKLWQWLAVGSALIAAAVHAYLLKGHYDLRYGEVAGNLLCDISSKLSCSAASASRWSEFLGVPMALWGMLTNIAFIVLVGWDYITDPGSRKANRTNLLIIAATLVLASLVMAGITLAALDSACLFCIATYVLSALTATGAWFAYKPDLEMSFKPVSFFGVAIAFAISGFILNDQFRSGYTGPGGDAMSKAAVQEWSQNPPFEIPETDPLVKGPARSETKMTIVEFADYRCIHCKLASAPLKAFSQSHPGVRLEFYTWPLDGECNTSIQQNNGASCLLARISWCAQNKAQKGWEAHDRIFARFEEWRTATAVRDAIPGLAAEIGIPAEQTEDFKTCTDSTEAKTAVEAQARLGSSLNLRGTPAIFVNGKALPAGSSIPVLNQVYRSLH